MADIRAILDCYAAARRDEVGVVQGCRIGLHCLMPPRPSHCIEGLKAGYGYGRAYRYEGRNGGKRTPADFVSSLAGGGELVSGVATRHDTTRHDKGAALRD